MEGFTDIAEFAYAAADELSVDKPTRRRKPRRPRLATLVKQAQKAGLTVTGITANGDLQVGEKSTDLRSSNSWDEALGIKQ